MAKVKMKIENAAAIDALMAEKIVQTASEYESDMVLRYLNKEVDLKSILGLMSLTVLKGSNIEIEASGTDATEAIKALEAIINK